MSNRGQAKEIVGFIYQNVNPNSVPIWAKTSFWGESVNDIEQALEERDAKIAVAVEALIGSRFELLMFREYETPESAIETVANNIGVALRQI